MAKVLNKHTTLAEEFYNKTYQGRLLVEGKLAGPKTIAKLKELMAQAKADGGKMSAAAAKYFKERNITLKPDGKKPAAAAAPEKKPAEKPATEKKETTRAATSSASNKSDEQRLRDTLDELKRAGADDVPSYTKDTTKEKLAESVQSVIDGLLKANPAAQKAQDKLDPEAMERAGQDCVGVFPDMRSPSCLSCSYKQECARQFVGNVKNAFVKFTVVSGGKDEAAEEQAPAKKPAEKKEEKSSKAPAEAPKKNGLDPKWPLMVNDLEKPEDAGIERGKSDEEKAQYAMVADILSKVPETVGGLRAIIDAHFDVTDEVFAEIVKSLEAEEIVLVERPKKAKAA